MKVAKVNGRTIATSTSITGFGGTVAVPRLDQLTDVVVVGINDGDVLIWDDATDTWLPGPSGASDPADDTYAWMPLTTVVAGEPVLVWDGDDNLIPTLTPV